MNFLDYINEYDNYDDNANNLLEKNEIESKGKEE